MIYLPAGSIRFTHFKICLQLCFTCRPNIQVISLHFDCQSKNNFVPLDLIQSNVCCVILRNTTYMNRNVKPLMYCFSQIVLTLRTQL